MKRLYWLVAALAAAGSLQAQMDPLASLNSHEIHFGVFGDLNYAFNATHDRPRGFSTGALDLYTTIRLSEQWSGLTELVLENDHNELKTDLERFQLTWSKSDALRLTAGRVHNPIVRWNVLQHHGAFMQTTIDKPAISRWEDQPGLWPAHFVGLMSAGSIAGPLGFHYDAGVGNGRGSKLDEVQVSGDRNTSTALLGGFGFAPGAVDGLDMTVSAYRDTITPAAGSRLSERDLTLSTSYLHGSDEIRAEWAEMRHKPDSRATYRTTGWYVLLSRSLPGSASGIRPYLLIDRLNPAVGEAFLEGAVRERSWAAGLRFDSSSHVAIKIDFRNENAGGVRDHVVRTQLAFSFQ